MKEYDKQSKIIRKQLENNDQENIGQVADKILICNRELMDKLISVLMRKIDTKKREREYVASKFPEYHEQLNLEARNTFHERVRARTLKCVMGYNHYGCRDKKINNNLIDDKYPRCQ